VLAHDKAIEFLKDIETPRLFPVAPRVNQNPLVGRARYLFQFSKVYFDKSRAFALAHLGIYNNVADFSGSWRPFKKSSRGV
jgi:hypothetical protein